MWIILILYFPNFRTSMQRKITSRRISKNRIRLCHHALAMQFNNDIYLDSLETIFFAFLSTTTGAVHLKKVEACEGFDICSESQQLTSINAYLQVQRHNKTVGILARPHTTASPETSRYLAQKNLQRCLSSARPTFSLGKQPIDIQATTPTFFVLHARGVPPFKPRITRFVNLAKIVHSKHRVGVFIGKCPAAPRRLVRVWSRGFGLDPVRQAAMIGGMGAGGYPARPPQ